MCIPRLTIKVTKKLSTTIPISLKCVATSAPTKPHQRATPNPKAIAMGFLTEIVQRHSIHIDITPPKTAGKRLVGNGPLITTIRAERTLSGVPKRRNRLVLCVLTKNLSVTKVEVKTAEILSVDCSDCIAGAGGILERVVADGEYGAWPWFPGKYT